jgi:hypothetical protein
MRFPLFSELPPIGPTQCHPLNMNKWFMFINCSVKKIAEILII